MSVKKIKYLMSLSLFAGLFLIACKDNAEDKDSPDDEKQTETVKFSVERAPEWTRVFKRDSGWFGGDGIFAIPYSGEDTRQEADSIIFLFSDTMVGEITGDSLVPGWKMVNNSMALYNKNTSPESTRFILAKDDKGEVTTMLTPRSNNEEYYWLGDGFVNIGADNALYIFAYRIRNTDTDDLLPFEETGNDLLMINDKDRPPFKDVKAFPIPFFQPDYGSRKISFGVGVYTDPEEDNYVYIYGVRGQRKNLVCARVARGEVKNFRSWEFRKENGWTREREQIASLADSVSNELSVSRIPGGKYALIYQYGGIFPKIYMKIGA
ncbi:hypothetical protein, partial [Sinomicrobium weinanense]